MDVPRINTHPQPGMGSDVCMHSHCCRPGDYYMHGVRLCPVHARALIPRRTSTENAQAWLASRRHRTRMELMAAVDDDHTLTPGEYAVLARDGYITHTTNNRVRLTSSGRASMSRHRRFRERTTAVCHGFLNTPTAVNG